MRICTELNIQGYSNRFGMLVQHPKLVKLPNLEIVPIGWLYARIAGCSQFASWVDTEASSFSPRGWHHAVNND